MKQIKETLYFQERKRMETANKRKVKRKLKVQEGSKAEKSRKQSSNIPTQMRNRTDYIQRTQGAL